MQNSPALVFTLTPLPSFGVEIMDWEGRRTYLGVSTYRARGLQICGMPSGKGKQRWLAEACYWLKQKLFFWFFTGLAVTGHEEHYTVAARSLMA
jgi:hypothetical protein